MKIDSKYIIIGILILFGIIGGLFWYINNLNSKIEQYENEIKIKNQNESAYADSISMMADSIQNYSVKVKNLQKENNLLNKNLNNIKNKYVLLQSEYYILIDSIKILNEQTIVDTSDSVITISFSGKHGKVAYQGNTKYFKYTGEGTYSINIAVDPSKVKSEIYLNQDSTLIKNNIYIDGALIDDATTIIDSSLYIMILNNDITTEKYNGIFDDIYLSLSLGLKNKYENNEYNIDKFYIKPGISYKIKNYSIYGKYDILNKDIDVGIKYSMSLYNIFE